MSDPFDYLTSRDDADSLIQDFGAAANVRRSTSSGTPWAPNLASVDYPTFAAVIEYTTYQRGTDSNILATDQRALVAAGPLAGPNVVPNESDSLVLVDGVRQIVKVTRLRPAGVDVFFDCQIRR